MYKIHVSLVNEDTETMFADWEEDLPDYMLNEDGTVNPGEVYRAARSEYGACRSKVYVDPREGGRPRHVGWFFVKRDRYEDTGEQYLRGAWVTVIEEERRSVSLGERTF